jgi:acyl carrier protein
MNEDGYALRRRLVNSVITFVGEINTLNQVDSEPRANIREDTTFADLALDSLDVVELSMELETEFGVNLQDVPITWTTVKEMVDCIVRLKLDLSPLRENGTNKGYVTTKNQKFDYNLSAAPLNTKMILLTCGGVALMGQLTGDVKKDGDIWGWCPLPMRDKQREQELGFTVGNAVDLEDQTHSTVTLTNSPESSK